MKRNLQFTSMQLCRNMALFLLFCTGAAQAQTATPVTVTGGFNADIIANGVGNASASTTQSFDETNTRALVSLDFLATAGGTAPTYGLPANGSITSAANSNVSFQLAGYSVDNALFLTPSYINNSSPDSGTLSFSASNVQTLYVLAGTAGGGLATVPLTATVNFSDNTTQVATISVADWYNGPDYAIQGIGRINTSNNNLEGAFNNPRLYQVPITLTAGNYNKTITGITFSLAGDATAEYGMEIRASILAVSAVAAPATVTAVAVTTAGSAPATITTDGGTLQLNAAVTPATAAQTVTWSITSGSSFATITSTGLVTATDNGTITVTATSTANSSITGTLQITITNQVPPAFSPVAITAGFNQDIIANGVGNASGSSTMGLDETNSRALVSLDFQANSSSALPTYGLPANGTIASAGTDDVTFQLASYSGNNALFLTPSYVNNGATASGTLSFSASNVGSLYILASAAGGGLPALQVNATINFNDNTTQVSTISVADWYDGIGYAVQGIGRVNRTNNNLEGNATNPRLYEINLPLNAANYTKTITGVTFNLNGDATAEYGMEIRASILAITTAVAPPVVTVVNVTTQNNAPATITTNNGTLQLVATVTPTTQAVTWSITAGADFATVSATGLVTATENGTVTVTATTVTGETDTIDIVITNQVTEVTAITISTEDDAPATITTNAGTLQLTAAVAPANATDTTVTWSITAGTGLATVDTNGLVTAIANGTVTVTATSANGVTDTIEIVITNQIVEVTALTITTQDNAPATITTIGGTLQLVATVTPANATDTTVVWSITAGTGLATVDANGLVTAIANGTVTVTATSANGVTTTFEVVVNIPTTGLDGLTATKISVYPNPTNGIININAATAVNFTVYNTLGQQVTAGKGTTVNLQEVQKGIYMLQITLEGGASQTVKVIKN
ncbi:T9SS type A sorting domain-containing protein [Flavobacterium zepuense]|uniref:T9SS type A sorting domain-containing protein n=1 Tax=Flavobacterium zepuense TaxID=2593302 RepID=A0A552V861_9FLAO|nr:Ig-like domain-containing protein [Flavobacterium zepuense]TRW26663.1 T9SS type A sorting domain-containing protein [Flavobacterium zepuense]